MRGNGGVFVGRRMRWIRCLRVTMDGCCTGLTRCLSADALVEPRTFTPGRPGGHDRQPFGAEPGDGRAAPPSSVANSPTNAGAGAASATTHAAPRDRLAEHASATPFDGEVLLVKYFTPSQTSGPCRPPHRPRRVGRRTVTRQSDASSLASRRRPPSRPLRLAAVFGSVGRRRSSLSPIPALAHRPASRPCRGDFPHERIRLRTSVLVYVLERLPWPRSCPHRHRCLDTPAIYAAVPGSRSSGPPSRRHGSGHDGRLAWVGCPFRPRRRGRRGCAHAAGHRAIQIVSRRRDARTRPRTTAISPHASPGPRWRGRRLDAIATTRSASMCTCSTRTPGCGKLVSRVPGS